MADSAEQTGSAATTITEPSFADFKAMKTAGTLPKPVSAAETNKPGADTAKPAVSDKPAPNSGADGKESQTSTKPDKAAAAADDAEITDADVEKENARVRRKMSRLLSDRAKERARADLAERENADLKTKLADKDKPKPAARVVEGRPKLKDYLDGKKGDFANFAEAHSAYEDDTDTYYGQKTAEDRGKESAKATEAQLRTAFRKSEAAFMEANPKSDWQESFTLVQGILEDRGALHDIIVRSEDPATVIHKLAHAEAFLESLSEMPDHRALAKLGAFIDKIEAAASAAVQASDTGKQETPEKKHPELPKPPKSVSARGDAPSGLQAMRNAADANDFASFRANKRAMAGSQK